MNPIIAWSTIGLTVMMGTAVAQSPTALAHRPPHPAPAPLLAAGLPAFAALGGAAFVHRIVRRRKTADKDQANGATSPARQRNPSA